MRRALLLLLLGCSNPAAEPPKVAEAPMRETAPIPTASTSDSPPPAPVGEMLTAVPTPSASAPPAGKKATGKVTAEECDKVNTHLAEVIAEGQGATLLQGFQSTEVWKGMREQCMKEVTREKYDCAMAAKSMAKWQECMK